MFLSFFSSLLQTNNWEKIMPILPSFPDRVPVEILKAAVLNTSQRVDWTEMVLVALTMSAADKLAELGAEVSTGVLFFVL